MRKSKVLKILREGGCALSTQVGTGNELLAGMAAKIGFDCLWLDTEHKCMSDKQVYDCIQAAALSDTDCVVRIKKSGYYSYFRPLEDGAAGIMVPHCFNADDAKVAVRNAKFYPLGLRGVDFSGPGSDYMLTPSNECSEFLNKENFVMLQIEDKEALDNIDEILDVDGIDLLFIGPADLTQSLAHHGLKGKDALMTAVKKVAEAVAKRENRWWGIPAGNIEQAKMYIDMGARFINLKGDLSLVLNGWKQLHNDFRAL